MVAGYPTSTLPSTLPPITCPNPSDVAIYNYFSSEFFQLTYPVNGDEVLRGSNQELALPTNGPQEIVLMREHVGFFELRFSVRQATSVTLSLTLANLTTVVVTHVAASDAVSTVNFRTCVRETVRVWLFIIQ